MTQVSHRTTLGHSVYQFGNMSHEPDGNLGKGRADVYTADTSHGPNGTLRRLGRVGRPGRIGDRFPRTKPIEVLTPLVPETSSTQAPWWAGGRREVAVRNERLCWVPGFLTTVFSGKPRVPTPPLSVLRTYKANGILGKTRALPGAEHRS
jgi:hypothetical protein